MLSITRLIACIHGVIRLSVLKDQAKENQNFLSVKTFSEFFR